MVIEKNYTHFLFRMLKFFHATIGVLVTLKICCYFRRNVGWASTCNSVGQTAGYFLGNILFLALESADFCNKYLRSEPQETGLITLAGNGRNLPTCIIIS